MEKKTKKVESVVIRSLPLKGRPWPPRSVKTDTTSREDGSRTDGGTCDKHNGTLVRIKDRADSSDPGPYRVYGSDGMVQVGLILNTAA